MPIKARASTFYRKAQRTAGAIVDLQNLLHVAVCDIAGVLLRIFGDGLAEGRHGDGRKAYHAVDFNHTPVDDHKNDDAQDPHSDADEETLQE